MNLKRIIDMEKGDEGHADKSNDVFCIMRTCDVVNVSCMYACCAFRHLAWCLSKRLTAQSRLRKCNSASSIWLTASHTQSSSTPHADSLNATSSSSLHKWLSSSVQHCTHYILNFIHQKAGSSKEQTSSIKNERTKNRTLCVRQSICIIHPLIVK